jgi:hypothetical protein
MTMFSGRIEKGSIFDRAIKQGIAAGEKIAMDKELFKILIRGMRAWQLRRRLTGKPMVLKGVEGEIIMDLLEAAVTIQDCSRLPTPILGCGRVFFNSFPIYCERELSTQNNKWCMKG